jgi:opacity protein-like surface antigen
MIKKIVALALLSAVAAPAFAANEGFYVGGTLGSGKLGVTSNVALSKTSDFVYGGLFGYQYSPSLAVEMQFTGIGKTTAVNGSTAKGDALSLVAVGALPITRNFELLGKLGAASTKTTTAGFTSQGTSRTGLTYGIGAQYDVSQGIAVRFGWDSYPAALLNAGTKTNGNANVISVGAVYKF